MTVSPTYRVLVVGPEGTDPAAIASAISTTTIEATAAGRVNPGYDCLVGIPGDEPVAFAEGLADAEMPALLYVGSDVDAGTLFETGIADVIRRDGDGSIAAVRAAVNRQVSDSRTTAPVADGGVETDRIDTEFPLKRLHEIATDSDLSRSEKITELLAAGAKRLETESAFLSRITDGTQQIVESVGDHPELHPGASAPLGESYCQYTIGSETAVELDDPAKPGSNVPSEAYDRFGLRCYLGIAIDVDGESFGTVCFVDTEPQSEFGAREKHFAEVLADWISYLLEQQNYQQELDQQRAFTESLMDNLPDPLYATDEAGLLRRWNSRFETVVPGNVESGADPAAYVEADDQPAFRSAIESALDGESLSVEAAVADDEDGDPVPYEFSNAPLTNQAGEVTGVAGLGRNLSEQQAIQDQLAAILDTTRSLMQARDRDHVAEIAVNAAKELLGFDISVFRLYDSERRALDPVAMTPETEDILGERPVYNVGTGYPGEVFASGESCAIPDLTAGPIDLDEIGANLGPARSAIYYPVGVHGTISVVATEPEAFDETDEQMLALLATSAAAACMRAKREQDVREAQEHTERVLDRVNGLVQNTVEMLVEATTREELEAGVVEELAAAEPYAFAWIGRPDVASETLSPTAWAGDASVAVQGRSFDLTRGDEPVSLAYREQEPQILPNLEDQTYGPWGSLAADTGVNSLLTIPLVYKDANYGVLSVFAADSGALDERERVVLESLGRVIANAINAIERGRILDATEIIELEFSVSDPDLLFNRLSSAADCLIESAGTDYQSDGNVRLYLTAIGGDTETLLAAARDDANVESATCIVEHDEECLLELTVSESVLATLTEYGAVPKEVRAENGSTRFTVELPYQAEAREVFELVEQQYPSTELLGYHERERAVETRQEFKAALSDRFTDRQETALRTAYLGGFFDWPRDIDGNELADAMDISRPTYHQHLRSAQRKVFEELFE